MKLGFKPRESDCRGQAHRCPFVILRTYELALPSGRICETGVRIVSTKDPRLFLFLPNSVIDIVALVILVSVELQVCQCAAILFDLTLTERDENSDHRSNAVLISKQMKSGKLCIF